MRFWPREKEKSVDLYLPIGTFFPQILKQYISKDQHLIQLGMKWIDKENSTRPPTASTTTDILASNYVMPALMIQFISSSLSVLNLMHAIFHERCRKEVMQCLQINLAFARNFLIPDHLYLSQCKHWFAKAKLICIYCVTSAQGWKFKNRSDDPKLKRFGL